MDPKSVRHLHILYNSKFQIEGIHARGGTWSKSFEKIHARGGTWSKGADLANIQRAWSWLKNQNLSFRSTQKDWQLKALTQQPRNSAYLYFCVISAITLRKLGSNSDFSSVQKILGAISTKFPDFSRFSRFSQTILFFPDHFIFPWLSQVFQVFQTPDNHELINICQNPRDRRQDVMLSF